MVYIMLKECTVYISWSNLAIDLVSYEKALKFELGNNITSRDFFMYSWGILNMEAF